MKVCHKPCKQCPFRRESIPGYLGGYSGPEHFLNVHYHQEAPNPCHMTVDYEGDGWEDRADRAPRCAGQAVMFANAAKLPRAWGIPEGTERDTKEVFEWPHEFLEHHNTPLGEWVAKIKSEGGPE